MIHYKSISEEDSPDVFLPVSLPWIYEAGRNYFDWIFGGHEFAKANLCNWLMRPSSEFAMSKVRLCFVESQVVGGFIAMGGNDLVESRRADILNIFKETRKEERKMLAYRLAALRIDTPPAHANEYFLSAMGVLPEFRGRGLGREILSEFVTSGSKLGYYRYKLNVESNNSAAMHLYCAFGFSVVGETVYPQLATRLLTMVKVSDE